MRGLVQRPQRGAGGATSAPPRAGRRRPRPAPPGRSARWPGGRRSSARARRHPLVVQTGQQLGEALRPTTARRPRRPRRRPSAERGPRRLQVATSLARPTPCGSPTPRCAGWPARSRARRPATAARRPPPGGGGPGAGPASRSGRAPARWSASPAGALGIPVRSVRRPAVRRAASGARNQASAARDPVDAALTLARRRREQRSTSTGPGATRPHERTPLMTTTTAARELDPELPRRVHRPDDRRPRRHPQRRAASSSATGSASTARWPTASPSPPRSWPTAPAPASPTSGRGWPTRRPAGTSSTTPPTDTWSMTPEQAFALAAARQPGVLRRRACSSPLGTLRDVPAIEERFRTGAGFGWHEHDAEPVRGHRAVLPPRVRRQPGRRPGCPRSTAWCPSSRPAADVVDVGCGHGASTILMAQAFPASTFVGLDYHEGSIVVARRRADAAGVADRVALRGRRRRRPARRPAPTW